MRVERLRVRAAVFALIVFAGVALDRITKIWALATLSDGRKVEILPHLLSLTLVRNPGASFGLGSSFTWVISILACAACGAMIAVLKRTKSLYWTFALALAFAGAFGNLIDRAQYADGFLDGKVVDFINYGWSVGNVADIELFVAALYIVLLVFVGLPLMEKSNNTIKDFAESSKSKDSEDSDSNFANSKESDSEDFNFANSDKSDSFEKSASKSDSFKNKFADSDSLDNDSKESCIDTHLDSEL